MGLQLVVYQSNASPYKIRCSVPKKRQYQFCMQRLYKALQMLKEDEKQHKLRNIRYARNLCLCTLSYFHAEGDTLWLVTQRSVIPSNS